MIRTALLVLTGWIIACGIFLFGWSRLPRPRLLRYGGVLQKRSPGLGVFVAGRTPKEAVRNLIVDPRFHARAHSTSQD